MWPPARLCLAIPSGAEWQWGQGMVEVVQTCALTAPCLVLACRVTDVLCQAVPAVPSRDPFQLRRPQAADGAAGSSPCQVVEVSAKS